MERYIRGAGDVVKVFLDRVFILLPIPRREMSRLNTLAWTRTTRSGSRGLFVGSVACAVAFRFVDDVGVEEVDAEAAAQSRRAMERHMRGAGVVAKVLLN